MTEIFCFALGMIVGGVVVGTISFFLTRKKIKAKEKKLDAEIKNYHRFATQFSNFLNYNGSSVGQEDVD